MPQSELVEQFKRFYGDLLQAEWAQLDSIYTSDIQFRDPVHRLEGRDALYRYLDDMCGNVSACRFVYLDQMTSEGSAYIKWNMLFSHPKVAGNRTITVRGITHLMFNEKGIFFHEDCYDMGAMLYEHLPLLGRMIAWLKGRLGAVSK